MKALIELLMKMGKTKEEALEIIGKDLPTGGIDNVSSNILKPITKKVVGDYPLVGSRITDPTSVKNFDLKSVSESIADQEKNWKKTFEFLSEGNYNLSALQKQNLTYNLGILQRSKDTVKNLQKTINEQKLAPSNVYDLDKNIIDVDKPILGGKNVELTHQEKIDWLVKNVSPTAEQTIPPKATLEAMLKDGREDLINHFYEMHTKELGKPRIDIDTSDLKHPGLVKKMMMDEKLKPTLVREPKDFANIVSMRPTDETLNKLVEEHQNNLRLINQTDAEGGTAIGYEKFKALQKRNEEIERIIENAKKVADEEDAAEAIGKAFSESSSESKITKPGQGKFTKAEYLIQRLKNTIKDSPDDKYIQENFPNFIKELEANPDLAKNENVFKELGGDLPDNQKITVYDDDTLDFFTKKPTKSFKLNVETFKRDFNVSDEEIEEILKLSPDEQKEVLQKYLDKDLKQRVELSDFEPPEGSEGNAQGGIIGLR